MKKIMIILVALISILSLTGCSQEEGEVLSMEEYLNKYTYANTKNLLPAEGNVGITNIGDPHVFYDENEEKYVMTGTFDGRVFKVWTSDDLTTWDQGTQIFDRGAVSWASETGLLWGAEIYEIDGTYYLYYSIEKASSTPRIGVATADNLFGPYVDKGSPMFDFDYSVIDNNLFIDTDGSAYMYYVKDALDNVVDGVHESHIYVVPVNSDYISTSDSEAAVELIVPDQSWEKMSGGSNWNWVEGCFMHKEGDSYYLFYSANKFSEAAYSVGYAISDSPTGPFVKSETNPLMYTVASEFSGPGNNSLFYSKDGKELFTAYHMHTDPDNPNGNRFLNIDRVGFRADGSVFFNGPTITNQPLPSGEYKHHSLISQEATVTVSSTMEGYNATGVNDGEISILTKFATNDWVANGIEDEYIQFDWDKTQMINSIYIYAARSVEFRPLSVTLEFSDGTIIEEVVISDFIGEAAILNFNGVICNWVKITVNETGFGQTAFGISEVMIFGTE